MPCRRVPKSTRPFEGSPIPRRARSPSRSTAVLGALKRSHQLLSRTRVNSTIRTAARCRGPPSQREAVAVYAESSYCISMMQGSSSTRKGKNRKSEKFEKSKTKAPTKAPQKRTISSRASTTIMPGRTSKTSHLRPVSNLRRRALVSPCAAG